jgi:putative ABC transport system permease protein
MKTLRTVWSRIRFLWRRREVKQEIDEELRFHLEQRTAENIAAGMAPEDAAREARKRFGNLQSVREKCRETRGASFGEATLQDVRFGLRMLRKNPGFTAIAVLTLALGIGVTTAMFSIIDGVLLRPLAIKEPERLVTVWERNPEHGYEANGVAPANFDDWKRQNQSFEQMALFKIASKLDLTIGDETERVTGFAVAANLFPMLGICPVLGRQWTSEDDTPGRGDVVVLSHRLWRRRFGGNPAVVGKTISLSGRSCTAIGVMPDGFCFPGGTGVLYGDYDPSADLWMPLALTSQERQNRGEHHWKVIAKLKPGVTLAQARNEMDMIQGRIHKSNSGYFMGTHCTLIPLREQSVGSVRTALLLLLGAVVFVLLIACANIASLLLVRATVRRKEFAVRVALGAGRAAIMRQLLVESVLLAALGGVLGAMFAGWSVPLLATSVADSIAASTPGWNEISVNGRVLVFALTVTLGTGILFGLAPAWQAAQTDVNNALKSKGCGAATGLDGQRLRNGLVVAEVAMAMMLLIGAGLLLRSFSRLQRVNPGFSPTHLLTFKLGLPEARFPRSQDRGAFVERLCERLQALPGVEFAAATTVLPLSGDDINNRTYRVVGRPPPEMGQFYSADFGFITPEYLRAMEIPLHAGRSFGAGDTRESPYVSLINDALARRQFPNEDPIGKKLYLISSHREMEIVGVMQDVKHRELDNTMMPAAMRSVFDCAIYMPYAQEISQYRDETSMVLRTSGDPSALAGAVRALVRELDTEQPMARLQTMESVISESVAQPRFRTALLGTFGALAVVLAAIGLHGVLAHTVAQRSREIGIRMALGARTQDVLVLVLHQGMRLVLIGMAVGLAGALALARLLSGLLFGVTPTDPVTFAVVPLLLATVALAACYLPARRASRVDPMKALRCE